MNNITTVSEITYSDCAEYMHLTEVGSDDIGMLTTLIGIAKAFITQYIGRTEEELDDYQDLVIVVLVLVQDMWDNRTLYVDSSNLNRVVDSILHMHSVNLL